MSLYHFKNKLELHTWH